MNSVCAREMGGAIKLSSNSLRLSSSLLTSFSSSLNSAQRAAPPNQGRLQNTAVSVSAACNFLFPIAIAPRKQLTSFEIHATVTETEQPKWWERNAGPNMIDIHCTQEFLDALCEAGEKLVIVEFYGTWCASCRALFPKLCRIAQEHPDILFLKVNFDENKPMCKNLNVKVLPFFHFYRGADGQLETFSCSLAKFQKIKDAINLHNTARCSLGMPKGVGDLNLESPLPSKEKLSESSGS